MHRLLVLVCAVACSLAAQTVTFAPQQTIGGLTLWSVTVSAPGKTSLPAAAVYQVAAAHQVGHVDSSLVSAIQTSKPSAMQIIVQVLGAGSAATAIAAVIKNGGITSTGTASEIQNAAIVGAGVAAVVLPYLQKNMASSAPIAGILGASLPLDGSGSGSAFFYSLTSKVGAFTDKLP